MGDTKERPLNPRQEAFIREYLVDLNGAQAAIRAGYSPAAAKEQASYLLTVPNIKAKVQAEMQKRAARTQITADNVLQQLAKQAFSDIRDFVYWDDVLVKTGETPDGEPIHERQRVLRMREQDEIDGTLITEIKEGRNGLEFKRTDPQKALELLGRHLSLFTDNINAKGDLSVTFNIPRPPSQQTAGDQIAESRTPYTTTQGGEPDGQT